MTRNWFERLLIVAQKLKAGVRPPKFPKRPNHRWIIISPLNVGDRGVARIKWRRSLDTEESGVNREKKNTCYYDLTQQNQIIREIRRENQNLPFLPRSRKARFWGAIVWANFALCSNCVWGSQAQYYPHSYKWIKEGPSPISSVRANEYLRTASRGMDKITIRGEVERACEELGRVRGRWSPRDFCPRYLVNSLITQNNAWDKSYNKAKGEISNKK